MNKIYLLSAIAVSISPPSLAFGPAQSEIASHLGLSAWAVASVLTETATTTAKSEAAKPEKKVICRRVLATGSLVISKKTCRTITERKRSSNDIRHDPEDLQTKKGGANTGR